MRILIAEDDLTSRHLLTAVLKKLGHEVVATCDGDEAWEVMKRPDAPRLVVLDWMMPNMDGLEVCQRIRTLETDRPPYIIMLTTLADKVNVVEGLDAGADDYLAKPFEHTELRARIMSGARVVALQERLATEATTDELTRLPNRRAGLDSLRRELARSLREDTRLGVGIVDVDHFKLVNDTYGHQVGDEVLRTLASRLADALRPYDHLCRFGGEEFLLVLPGATRFAPWERLRAVVVGTPFHTKACELEVTISIGHASASGQSDPDALIAAADRALYRAKESGRNRIECEDDVDQDHSADREDVSKAVAESSRSASEPRTTITARVANPERILVAEDDMVCRNVLTAMLEKRGHDVVATCDGAEALEVMSRPDAPRLAIIDWLMPRADGLEVCRRIRTYNSTQPPYLIMLTVLGDRDRVVSGLDAGADDYMVKPLEPVELRARIDVGTRMLETQDRLITRSVELREALTHIKTLKGLIPICSHCKRVRDDGDYWHEVEDYVSAHTDAFFSHGLCPKCLEEHYPDVED